VKEAVYMVLMMLQSPPALQWVPVITSGVAIISSAVAMYVSNRLLKYEVSNVKEKAELKEWLTAEMTKIVKENCAGKEPFENHVKADELFQKTIMTDIAERRASNTAQHQKHFDHAERQDIHQVSMPTGQLEEKFANFSLRLEQTTDRIDHLTKLFEKD